VGGAPAKRKNVLYERINGNGELTETENVIFLRKLRGSYGILTDDRNSYVLLQRTTEMRLRRNGYVMVETTHYCATALPAEHVRGRLRAFLVAGPTLWNSLPILRNDRLRKQLKTDFFCELLITIIAVEMLRASAL